MRAILVTVITSISINVLAQDFKFKPLDVSQADFAYYPKRAVKEFVGDTAAPLIKVSYSRPSSKGRVIFGGLLPFGELWRIGANESTEIRFFKPVQLAGKKIAAGTYTLFAIPENDRWEVVVNCQTDTWGPYGYDKAKDILRFSIPTKQLSYFLETLSITFMPLDEGATLIIGWEKTYVEIPIKIEG